jgi:hypothetical protein
VTLEVEELANSYFVTASVSRASMITTPRKWSSSRSSVPTIFLETAAGILTPRVE